MSGNKERLSVREIFDYFEYFLNRTIAEENTLLMIDEDEDTKWYHHACFYCEDKRCPWRSDGYNQENSITEALNGLCLGMK